MDKLLSRIDSSQKLSQFIPITLTIVILGLLIAVLHACLFLLNKIPGTIPILLVIRPQDVLVGATIYLKTEIDFAIFIGRLMETYPGWRNRVALEIGSAIGNASGTILIIGIWVILKHVDILLALMVILASLVLFELAYAGTEYINGFEPMKRLLWGIHRLLHPILSRIIPDLGANLKGNTHLSWKELAAFSTKIPFILGLDDFAGYVPLFSVINVYGFAVGVIAAHTALNLSLFISPKRTITVVKNQFITLIGTIAFIGLGIYGLAEAGKIVFSVIR